LECHRDGVQGDDILASGQAGPVRPEGGMSGLTGVSPAGSVSARFADVCK